MDKYEIHIPPKEFQELAPEYIRPPEEFTTPVDTYQEHITSKRKKYIKMLYASIIFIIIIVCTNVLSTAALPSIDTKSTVKIPESTILDINDPIIEAYNVFIERAASSNYRVVSYNCKFENTEYELPIDIYASIIDSFGHTSYAENPIHITKSTVESTNNLIELDPQLDESEGLFLILTTTIKKDDQTKDIVLKFNVEDYPTPQLPIVDIISAVCEIDKSAEPDIVEYKFTLDPNGITTPITIYTSVEDDTNYVKVDSYTYDPEKEVHTIEVTGLTKNMTLSISTEFEDEISGQIYYPAAECPVEVIETEVPYPLTDEDYVVIIVHNNTFNFGLPQSDIDWQDTRVLAKNEFEPGSFTEYELPFPELANSDGMEFRGWIIHNNWKFDPFYDENSYEVFIPVKDGIITKSMVECIEPDEYHVRYINVHAMWVNVDEESIKASKETFTVDDGFGNITTYDSWTPLASEGVFYLYAIIPEIEGKKFAGWYNQDGIPVNYISFYDFYNLLPNAQSIEDRDWEHKKDIHITAHWRDN